VAVLKDQPAGVHEAIHDGRKSFKRPRSLYRLIACDAPLFQKQENARIRDVARNLSTVRNAACETSTEAKLLRELRKRAQDYRMNLGLLRETWPSAMQAKRAETKELVDVLGHLNDLATMTSLINEEPELAGDSHNQAHLLSAAITRQEDLRLEALQRAAAVFLDDPGESRMIELLWLEAGR
jgi:CHAD domain-containing protein